jgi:hypothetical protein
MLWPMPLQVLSGGYNPPRETPLTLLTTMTRPYSVEALRDFVYKSKHLDVLRDRARWFEKMEKPYYCLWWVPSGHIPAVAEGRERLEHCQLHGATPYSFWFSKLFPAEESAAALEPTR